VVQKKILNSETYVLRGSRVSRRDFFLVLAIIVAHHLLPCPILLRSDPLSAILSLRSAKNTLVVIDGSKI